ncbi:hypothetical protein MWU61_02730 [Loktanella sp. F6476L]|uniref:hypothetical protein n=1 Tax=Loktanella sp. F6476L TaxID=2926405 RepID=UPI001FF13FD7|nr:hypothetical protein [Loktanella sp. F6476L]MCK0119439.1 hypothetical protein [Loktanella sp. F6476L]
MRVDDIVDGETFESYFETLNSAQRFLYFRNVALFVLVSETPLILRDMLSIQSRPASKFKILPTLASVLLSVVASSSKGKSFNQYDYSAFLEASLDEVESGENIISPAFFEGQARLMEVCCSSVIANSTIDSGISLVAQAGTSQFDPSVWKSIKQAIELSIQNRELDGEAFELNGYAEVEWSDVKSALAADQQIDWSFWIAWYERLLVGKDIYVELLSSVLSEVRETDWLDHPGAVNARFETVLAAYQADDIRAIVTATPIAANVVYENETLQLRPTDQIADSQLSVVLNQIEDATRIFDGGSFGTNSFPLNREIEILNSALSRYRSRPVELLKTVTRVCKRLDVKIENGECPSIEKDADIADFREVLIDVQLDLIAFNPDVKAYHYAKKRDVDEQAAPSIAEAAREVSASADSAFATALSEAAFTLLDPTVDDFARQAAQYWIIGSVTRSYKAAKMVVDEAADVTKKAATISAGVAWLLSPQFRMFIDDVIKLVAP